MKLINHVTLVTIAVLVLVGCKKSEISDEPMGEPASMKIVLKGSHTEANPIKQLGQDEENTITDFTVYVYNGTNNLLEKAVTFTPGNVSAQFVQNITGLIAGPKKIIVVANQPTGYSVAPGSLYSALAANMFDLGTQLDSTDLTMSGETTTTLASVPATNPVTINLNRVVAKLRVGTITLTPDPGHTGTFVLDSVYIMKAKATATVGVPTVVTGPNFYGGIAATVSQTARVYLRAPRAINPALDNAYFMYLFPNDNTTGNGTLITLVGTYNSTKFYYPFRINNGVMLRNTYYTINITIKRPGSGSTDPETPVDPATLDITITPVDWDVVIAQNVEW